MTIEEFKQQVLPSKQKLFRTALALLKNRQDAEDVLQDAMVKLWNMRNRLQEYRSIEALAVTMTRNLCLDRLRSYRHRKKNDSEVESLKITGSGSDPAVLAELSESMKVIHRIIETLPDRQRQIINLRDIEQYSYDEIEQITGLNVNNIRVTLSRARKKVRKEYLKHQDYGNQKD